MEYDWLNISIPSSFVKLFQGKMCWNISKDFKCSKAWQRINMQLERTFFWKMEFAFNTWYDLTCLKQHPFWPQQNPTQSCFWDQHLHQTFNSLPSSLKCRQAPPFDSSLLESNTFQKQTASVDESRFFSIVVYTYVHKHVRSTWYSTSQYLPGKPSQIVKVLSCQIAPCSHCPGAKDSISSQVSSESQSPRGHWKQPFEIDMNLGRYTTHHHTTSFLFFPQFRVLHINFLMPIWC